MTLNLDDKTMSRIAPLLEQALELDRAERLTWLSKLSGEAKDLAPVLATILFGGNACGHTSAALSARGRCTEFSSTPATQRRELAADSENWLTLRKALERHPKVIVLIATILTATVLVAGFGMAFIVGLVALNSFGAVLLKQHRMGQTNCQNSP